VLVEHVRTQNESFLPSQRRQWRGKNQALRQLFRGLCREGLPGLHLVAGEALLGSDGEATVDGIHPTDLGFMRMADALEPLLRPLV
jgi:lysophospholipase L1-like esterase